MKLTFWQFLAVIGDSMGVALREATSSDRLEGDLGFDIVQVCQLEAAVARLNPYFALPSECHPSYVTLADVFYYYQVMSADYYPK